jgi:signal transduction histidine kinase
MDPDEIATRVAAAGIVGMGGATFPSAVKLNLRKRSVNLTELVEQVIERLQLRIEEKGIDLRTTIPVGLPRVQADPERLSQILSNLVDNALRYTPAGTLLEVSAKNIEEGTQVSVIDNGPGIPEDELPKLFDRFWRAEKSRNRATGGSGLGLAIVKQLVMAHGGRVWAENLPGKGVQFNIILPG